jgi:uncharacterized protein (DUF1697 family)
VTHFVAFLRGIGPGDPAKSNEGLRGAFETMGFSKVTSFISSGNILFESDDTDLEALERRIEQGLSDRLGITVPTVVKSGLQLKTFLESKPFGKNIHGAKSYLTVTFLKSAPRRGISEVEADAHDKSYIVVRYDKKLRALCCMIDQTASDTTRFMVWLERQYGKNITTRTAKTIERVTAKLRVET